MSRFLRFAQLSLLVDPALLLLLLLLLLLVDPAQLSLLVDPAQLSLLTALAGRLLRLTDATG